MGKVLSEFQAHLVKGLDPVADFNDGTTYSDIVRADGANWITFLYYKGVGATGTSTLTVQPCDDVTPSNTGTAVAFKYRVSTSGDTWGALQSATASGFTTTAGSSQLYAIEVDPETLGASGYNFLRLKMVEVVNSPVVGCVLILMGRLRYGSDIDATAIA